MHPGKLTNKPETKSSKDFHVEFSNAKIEKFKPTFGTSKARYLVFSFDVPKGSHLKGLALKISKATKKKFKIPQNQENSNFLSLPQTFDLYKNIISNDFLLGFSTVNVEYDILLEKRGFGDRSVREKSLFFRFQKKMYSFDKNWILL